MKISVFGKVAVTVVLAVALSFVYPAAGQATETTVWPSGDSSGIADYNNLMNALNGPLGATANIRCVAGADLVDGETVGLQDVDGDTAVFEFDKGTPIGVQPGNIPVLVDDVYTRFQVAGALSDAINSSALDIDAVALPDIEYNIDWVLLTQSTVGTTGNGLPVAESVLDPNFIAQGTFEGGSGGPGPSPGDTISLDAGYFYLSRPVRVEGFNGTVRGAGNETTIIEAVRESQERGGGFGFAYDPYWEAADNPMLAGLFQFFFPQSITFRDLTLQVTDPTPCDLVDYEGGITGLAGFALEIAGSIPEIIPDIEVKNVKILGAAGDTGGKNLPWAMFVALGEGGDQGKGNVVIKNCHISDAAWRGIVLAYLTDGSSGSIKGCTIENSGDGIRGVWIDDSLFEIKDNALSGVWRFPIYFYAVSGADVRDNSVSGGTFSQVRLQSSSYVNVISNTFQDFTGLGYWWTVPIDLRDNNHDCVISDNRFINISGAPEALLVRGWNNSGNTIQGNRYNKSGLPGWNEDHPGGPGCVLLGPGATGNYVDEWKFPPGTDLCEQVLDLDGGNEIAGWSKECE